MIIFFLFFIACVEACTTPLTLHVTNNAATAYNFTEYGMNPSLVLVKGLSYTFVLSAPGNPFWINTIQGPTASSNAFGVTNNGATQGSVVLDISTTYNTSMLFYNCQFHAAMTGIITIIDSSTCITTTSTSTTTQTPTTLTPTTLTPTTLTPTTSIPRTLPTSILNASIVIVQFRVSLEQSNGVTAYAIAMTPIIAQSLGVYPTSIANLVISNTPFSLSSVKNKMHDESFHRMHIQSVGFSYVQFTFIQDVNSVQSTGQMISYFLDAVASTTSSLYINLAVLHITLDTTFYPVLTSVNPTVQPTTTQPTTTAITQPPPFIIANNNAVKTQISIVTDNNELTDSGKVMVISILVFSFALFVIMLSKCRCTRNIQSKQRQQQQMKSANDLTKPLIYNQKPNYNLFKK
jgi:hypothetical protein